MRSQPGILLSTLLLLVLSNVVLAETIFVPSDFPTLQEAIDGAAPGDTIDIGSTSTGQASIVENVIIDKELTITGSPFQRIIAADPTKAVVTIRADLVRLESLEVRGGKFGIYARGDGLQFVSIRSQLNSRDGILLSNCEDFLLDDVRVLSNKRYGIREFNCVFGQYTNTRAFLNRTGFMITSGLESRLSNCFAFDNDDTGIVFRDCDTPIAESTRSVRNGFGIRVKDSENGLMDGNFIADNAFGYEFVDSSGEVFDDFVRDNSMDGVVGNDATWVLNDMLIANNGGDGITWEGSNSAFIDCLVRDHGGTGLRVSGENNFFTGTISRRNQVGFELSGDVLEMFGNRSSGNVEEGYRISDSSNSFFEDNVAVSDGADGFWLGNVTDSGFSIVRAISSGGNGFVFSDDSENNFFINGFAGRNALFGFVDEGTGNVFENTFCDDEGNGSGGSSPAGLCD